MKLPTTFRIGEPRRRGEGLRLLVARRPPRGVKRADWTRVGRFDVWVPALAPSAALVRQAYAHGLEDPKRRARYFAAYEREMSRTEPRQTIALLAALARRTPISIGCYCEDETRCHRGRLRALVARAQK